MRKLIQDAKNFNALSDTQRHVLVASQEASLIYTFVKDSKVYDIVELNGIFVMTVYSNDPSLYRLYTKALLEDDSYTPFLNHIKINSELTYLKSF